MHNMAKDEGSLLILAQTPVGQSAYFVHTDPTIYPNPYTFGPDRWVQAAKDGIPLNKFLVSFTKGSRQCIGIQYAAALDRY